MGALLVAVLGCGPDEAPQAPAGTGGPSATEPATAGPGGVGSDSPASGAGPGGVGVGAAGTGQGLPPAHAAEDPPAGGDPRGPRAAGPPSLAVLDDWPTGTYEGLLNGGFEWIADATTDPPKYGAYWLGAFAPVEGDPTDRIEERADAAEGLRVLVLPGDGSEVLQKIVADERYTEALVAELAWRPLDDGGTLRVTLVDGPGRRTSVDLSPDAGADDTLGPTGWRRVRLDVGRLFAHEHGAPPTPRLQIVLAATGGGAEVDDVRVAVTLSSPSARQLASYVMGLVRWTLDAWFLPRERGGLGLVDPATGYVRAIGYDVDTGEDIVPARTGGFHTVHVLLIEWLRLAHAHGWQGEIDRWTPELARITTTILERNVHPETGLPRTVDLKTGRPFDDVANTVGSWVEFLIDARELLGGELGERCATQVRRMADTLLALQAAHDLDPKRVFNDAKLDPATGVFEGTWPNWFGHIPNKLTATGEIDTPRRYNTAWAIVKERTFWYHFFKSPAAIMAAHALDPRPGDLEGVRRSLTRYHRAWDAARYDLENDTDDHYGYLCEDLMTVLAHSGGQTPRALELVQEATDHRLARDTGVHDDTLWIQAVRLGTACAGDSPRAFVGVLALHDLPPDVNPISSDLPLYRDALLELAANDFKGRQLTNGQFTESFFKSWEMVCICFRGTYQGDCREHPADYWQGDVGDIFGGPPMQGIEAQIVAYQVAADDAQRAGIRARLATILYVTETTLRRPFGYVYGLDPAIARQYELPDKYTVGLDHGTARGLGTVLSWIQLLPHLAQD